MGVVMSAIGFGGEWTEGVYTGVNTAQKIRWDEDCSCFAYFGDTLRLDSPVGG